MSDNAKNNMNGFIESLIKGMDGFLTTKTVVGDAIHVGETIILPLVDVSFGVGVGAGNGSKGENGGGGIGGKLTPSAVLVINNGSTKLVNVKNQDSMTKILDMVPDIINKFTVPAPGSNQAVTTEDAVTMAFPQDEDSDN